MKLEDIIDIALEAGFTKENFLDSSGLITYFATLVAAAEREECADLVEQMGLDMAAAIRARGEK